MTDPYAERRRRLEEVAAVANGLMLDEAPIVCPACDLLVDAFEVGRDGDGVWVVQLPCGDSWPVAPAFGERVWHERVTAPAQRAWKAARG